MKYYLLRHSYGVRRKYLYRQFKTTHGDVWQMWGRHSKTWMAVFLPDSGPYNRIKSIPTKNLIEFYKAIL